MNEQQNPQLETAQQEAQKLSEVLQVRRDKLDALQAAGRDPFAITSYQRTATAATETPCTCAMGRMTSTTRRLRRSLLP